MAGSPSARYSIVHAETTPSVLTIRDDGGAAGYRSVTNDAERVVAKLHAEWLLPVGRKLMYYDTQGDLDELCHDGMGHFTGFAPGPGRLT